MSTLVFVCWNNRCNHDVFWLVCKLFQSLKKLNLVGFFFYSIFLKCASVHSFPHNVNLKIVREHHPSAGEITQLFSAASSVFILQRDQPSFIPGGQFSPQALGNRSSPQAICNPRQAAFEMRMHERQNSVSGCSEAFAQRKERITACVTPGIFL